MWRTESCSISMRIQAGISGWEESGDTNAGIIPYVYVRQEHNRADMIGAMEIKKMEGVCLERER